MIYKGFANWKRVLVGRASYTTKRQTWYKMPPTSRALASKTPQFSELEESRIDSIQIGKSSKFNDSRGSFQQLERLFWAYVRHVTRRHNRPFDDYTLNRFFEKVLRSKDVRLNSLVDMFSQFEDITYVPTPQVTQTIIERVKPYRDVYFKLLNCLIQNTAIKFTPQTFAAFVQCLSDPAIDPQEFILVVKLMISRQYQEKRMMKTEELLHRIVENIQNMNQLNKSYFIAEADRIIAEWIANNKKSFPISEDTHFSVGVLSISFGLPPLFVESLHQMKNKNRLLSHLRNYPKPEQTAFLSCLTATASSQKEKQWAQKNLKQNKL